MTDFSSGDVRPLALSVWANVKAGHRDQALAAAQRLEQEATPQHSSHFVTALAFAALGDMDNAFEVLGAAADNRWLSLAVTLTLPPYYVLRSDPRFDQLLERMGLRELWERNGRMESG